VTSQGQRFRRRALRRGYKVDEVDAFLDRVEATLAGDPIGPPVAAQEVHDVVFRVRFGGYDEWQVDLHLDRVERQLGDVEERTGGGLLRPAGREDRLAALREDSLHPRRPATPAPPMPQRPLTPMPAMGAYPGGMPMAGPGLRPMSGPPLPGQPMAGQPLAGQPSMPMPMRPMASPPMSGPPMSGPPMSGPPMSGPPMSGPPMGAPYGGGNGYQGGPTRFDQTEYTPGGFGNSFGGADPYSSGVGRRGRMDMTHEMRFDLHGSIPTSGGPASPTEVQRIDSIRRTFTARRFGSGYDALQVNRLFDAIIASLSGRSGMPLSESELDPNQFSLVPGGYFEAEVNQALREVRDLVRR
jgi:DivIVA domain-containing protein